MTEAVESIKAVQKVRINKISTLYKDGEPANAIELVNFDLQNGEPCGFDIVSQKGLYQVGDSAYYVIPDHTVEDNALFCGFVAPDGDPKKTKLGKGNRIRAIKFNFTKSPDDLNKVFSNGILLQEKLVLDYLRNNTNKDNLSLSVILGVTKYEEPEKQGTGMAQGEFPSFAYKTDETNFKLCKRQLEKVIENGELLGYSLKHDGSSWTEYCKQDEHGEWKVGVCSRSFEKKLNQKQVTQYKRTTDNLVFSRYFNRELNARGWFNETTNEFYTQVEIDGFIEAQPDLIVPIEVDVRDSWIDLANKYDLINSLPKFCAEINRPLVLRGEINGEGLKGSGNKYNPSAKLPANLILFGVDDLSSGTAIRVPFYGSDVCGLKQVSEKLGVPYAEMIKEGVYNSVEELLKEIQTYFDYEKDVNGRVVEGVVLRTLNTNNLSVKVMNDAYDACK